MKLQPADIILFGGEGGLLSKGIIGVMNFFQKDPVVFYHAMLVENDTNGIEAVLKIKRTNLFERLNHADKYKILRHKNLTPEKKASIVKASETLLGKGYSITRLLLQLLDQIFHTNFFSGIKKDNMDHVCSSLVAWAYYSRTKIKFNGVEWRSCEPDDIDDESLDNENDWEVIIEK